MKAVGVLDDNLGIAISWLSIGHCLAVPVMKLFAPSFHWSHSASTHILLASFVIFFGIAAITQEQLQHCNLSVRLRMVPGIVTVMAATIGVLLGPEHLEVLALTAGNLLVILAHHQNKRLIHVHNAITGIEDDHTTPAQSERYYA